jgi:hypothetical protein
MTLRDRFLHQDCEYAIALPGAPVRCGVQEVNRSSRPAVDHCDAPHQTARQKATTRLIETYNIG